MGDAMFFFYNVQTIPLIMNDFMLPFIYNFPFPISVNFCSQQIITTVWLLVVIALGY